MEVRADDCREKGNQCMKEEKHIEAMIHYTHGIKLEPHNAYLYSNRSQAFLRMQQYYYALEDAKKTIELMPSWTKGYHLKGDVECAAEHYKEAIESFKQGLRVNPEEMSLKEGVVKATYLFEMQRHSDSRIVWYGIAMGALVGILLMVLDEAVAKQPMLQGDPVRVMVIAGLSAVCYGIALLYRMFVRSQRSSMLERPVDLLSDNDAVNGFPSSSDTDNCPSKSSSSSSLHKRSAMGQ